MCLRRRNLYFYLNCRDIDLNGLVGHIGGYIGLILGYSLLQIPELILLLSTNAKKYVRNRAASVSSNFGIETPTRNANCGCEHTLLLLQSELKQLSRNMVEFSQEIRGEMKVIKKKIEIDEVHHLCK